MRKTPILGILSSLLISTAPLIHAATQTIEGVISDTMCGRNHMEPGKTDAQCIQECMKGKVGYALVTERKIYTLSGKAQSAAAVAGKNVRVQGDLNDNTLTVISIHETKPGTKHQMDM